VLPLFHPEKFLIFRPLPEQMIVLEEMYRIYHRQIDRGFVPEEAFYESYVRTHQTEYGIATSVGHIEFHRRMSEYLRMAMNMVESVISDYLKPFKRSLAAHNMVANCLDPIQMLIMAGSDPGPKASSLQKRLYFESRRQLGIGLQLFAIEEADNSLGVAEDLTQIDTLSREKLFLSGVSRDIWVVGLQDTHKEHQIVCVLFFDDEETARRQMGPVPEHILPYGEAFMCRVAQVGHSTYIVYADPRRKRMFASVLKLERGRSLSDRRGWKYVVVGVEQRGKLRVATREDAETFLSHTQNILWKYPLVPQENSTTPNPHRDITYWDCKVIGTYHKQHQGRIIAGPAEQLVTTVQDDLNASYARSSVNHELYRAKQIDNYLCELWFPHSGTRYQQHSNFRSPHYGVDWGSQQAQERLTHWRINQII